MMVATICPNCFMETEHIENGTLLTCQRCGHTHSEGADPIVELPEPEEY